MGTADEQDSGKQEAGATHDAAQRSMSPARRAVFTGRVESGKLVALMRSTTVDLETSAGINHTQIVTPDGDGPWPAVILCTDAGGQRQAMTTIAEQLAGRGYLVAIPDLYFRVGKLEDLVPEGERAQPVIGSIFANPERRKVWFERYYASATDAETVRLGVGAVLDHLAGRGDTTGKLGTTGYCMGGNISLRVATIFGDRIQAAASFHGGELATPAPTSPHRQAAQIKARVYVAGAIEDTFFDDEARRTLEAALTEAGVEHTIETYPGRHGFAVTDNPTYDPACEARHYAALESLYAATLRG